MGYSQEDDATAEFLAHYGVKGMKWGFRKDRDSVHRFQTSEISIDPSIHKSTRDAATEVSRLIAERYGYNIKHVKTIKPGDPEYPSTVAYVENKQVFGNNNDGTVFIQTRNLTDKLKQTERSGWMSPGTGNVKALLTHESSHSIFHAGQVTKMGFLGPKIKGGEIKARDKALRAAVKAAGKDGQSIWVTSGYSRMAGSREELEAELFSNYHWGTNPPRFVNEWGKTLHQELGLDPTPFKEVK